MENGSDGNSGGISRGQAAIVKATPSARRLHAQAAIECCGTARLLRGQAAMEYLVTYGWALLVLVAVVGVIFATGLFSPNNFTTQECVFQPDIPCNSFILYQAQGHTDQSTLQFSITNGLGFPINITNISYIATDLGESGRHSYQDQRFLNPNAAIPLVSGERHDDFSYTFNGTAQPDPGATRSILVSITYLNCRHSPCTGPYTTTGRISASLQAVS
ncbi:MAG: hypothetical protein NT051_03505 [Candidatus Micrarchaeota archaeon]|nr:hypothetical protein [Candidatus Micrarchaeota archaeon]